MTSNEFSNDAASEKVSNIAQAIRSMLSSYAGITDCLTVVVPARAATIRVYVVSTESFPESRFSKRIGEEIAGFDNAIDVQFVAVSNLPLTVEGEIDVGLLSELPVIDHKTAATGEHRLQARYPGARISVDIVERDLPTPFFHYTDLGIRAHQFVTETGVIGQVLAPTPAGRRVSREAARKAIVRNAPLAGEKVATTLCDALYRAADGPAERGVGYIDELGDWSFQSYTRLYEDAKRILAAMQNQGIFIGQKVVLQLPRNSDFIPAFWACQAGGIIPIPMSRPSTYSDSSNTTLRNFIATLTILDKPAILTSSTLDKHIARLFQRLDLPESKTLTIEDLRESGYSQDPSLHYASPEDLAMLLFTSGSTGHPKGICYTHRNLIENIASSASMNRVVDADVSLNWLNLDHVGSLVRCCIRDIYVGNTQIHAATQLFLHDPLRWFDWIEAHRVTFAWAPNFGLALLNERLREAMPESRDLSFVRSILSVAEPIVPAVAREFAANMLRFEIGVEKLHSAWGMSETCAGVVFSHDFLRRFPSHDYPFVEVGRPVPGLSIRVVDDVDHVIDEGDAGHVQIAGEMVIKRYFSDENSSREAYTDDGWFRTGDLGIVTDGRLTITGREKDTIIINGRNIASHEIESVVDAIPGIEKTFTAAVAVRERHKDTDQLAVFFHTGLTKPGEHRLLLERIQERVQSAVGVRPAYLLAVERQSIPRSSLGKILRSQLRDGFLNSCFDAWIKRSDMLLENERTLPGWFFKRIWIPKRIGVGGQLSGGAGVTIIFQDSVGLAKVLEERLEARGHTCLLVRPGKIFDEESTGDFVVNPGDERDYRLLLEAVFRVHPSIRCILHLWAYTPSPQPTTSRSLGTALDLWFMSLAFLAKALAGHQDGEQMIRIQVCSTGAQPVSDSDDLCCEKGLALGLIRTLPQELPFLDCRHCDLPAQDIRQAATLVVEELATLGSDREVAYRDGTRYIPVLKELTETDFLANGQADLEIQSGGLYLITGGFGDIGLEIAQTLIRDQNAKLLLVGRKPLPAHERTSEVAKGESAESERFAKALQRYRDLRVTHRYIEYRAIDICDHDALREATEEQESRWQTRLCGIFHLARVTDDKLVQDQTGTGLLNTLKPKVQGTLSVGRLLESRPEAFFVGFSSVSSTFGTYRMAAYAAANRFLDYFCLRLRNRYGRAAKSLAWSIWEDVGTERHYQMRDLSRRRGLFTLSTEKGIASMFAAMRSGETGIIIGLDPGNRSIRQWMVNSVELVHELRATISFSENGPSQTLAASIDIRDRLGRPVVCRLVDGNSSLPKRSASSLRAAKCLPVHAQRRAELEPVLIDIWQELLRVDCVEPEDDFFELGGHSILGAQFVGELARRTGDHIELSTLFEHPVLQDLVDTLAMRQAGMSQHTGRQMRSVAQLSGPVQSHYETIRLALRRQFPQILELFPMEHYVGKVHQLPEIGDYGQIGATCSLTIRAIGERTDNDLEPAYNRLALVHAMQSSIERFERRRFPREIEELFGDWFHSILASLTRAGDDYFRLDNDPFLKDMAVCTGRMVPIGGAWTIELSGISRQMFLSAAPRHLLARVIFLFGKMRAFKPFFQIHMTQRFADRFTEHERTASYMRVAEMLRAHPSVRGLIGASWYLDPALKTISPELSYLQDLPESNGARIFPLTPSTGIEQGALVGSDRRTQLFEEGKYSPRKAFLVWPREALLRWAETRT